MTVASWGQTGLPSPCGKSSLELSPSLELSLHVPMGSVPVAMWAAFVNLARVCRSAMFLTLSPALHQHGWCPACCSTWPPCTLPERSRRGHRFLPGCCPPGLPASRQPYAARRSWGLPGAGPAARMRIHRC